MLQADAPSICAKHSAHGCSRHMRPAYARTDGRTNEPTKTVGHLIDRTSPFVTRAHVQKRIDVEVGK